MKWLRGVIAAAVLAMVAVPMVGQTPDTRGLRFEGTAGVRASDFGTDYNSGVHVGPYYASYQQILGLPNLEIYCVDYLHTISWTSQWSAFFTPLNDATLVGGFTRYGQSVAGDPLAPSYDPVAAGIAAQGKYSQAAWLAMQFRDNNKPQWADIHAAIWHVMTGPSLPTWGGYPSNATGLDWIAMSRGGAGSVNMSEWYVLTDTQGGYGYATGGKQEFLTRVNVVPEPATILLMGTGLVAVMGMTLVMRQSLG